MKAIIFAFAVLVAGINAVPYTVSEADTRLVTDAIASAIEDLSQDIKDRGLDPYLLERAEYSYGFPVPVLFSARAWLVQVESVGLSNIVINNLNFGVLTSRLSFDIALPLVAGSVGNVVGEATVFGNQYEAQGSGSLEIRQIRVVGQARVSVGIISGISVSSLTLDFTVGDIDPEINLQALGYDLSPYVNTFLGTTVPAYLQEFRSEINQLLEIIVLDIINDLL